MFIYLVKVYLYDHNSFIGIVNFSQLNIYRWGAPGKLPRSPLSAPLLGINRTDLAFTEFSRKDFSKLLKIYLNMRDNQEW